MRATLNIDDALLAQVGDHTGETEPAALVRMGLEALIEREAAHRLASLGGTMPELMVPPRRRPEGPGITAPDRTTPPPGHSPDGPRP